MTERNAMKNLKVLVEDCKDILNDLGINYGPIASVTVNSRLTACWGRCKYNKRTGYYTIEFSSRLMKEDIDYEATMNTVIHEFLHAGKNRMCHTGEWKRLAELVNKEYPQFNITRCTSGEEKGVANRVIERNNYIVRCPECGREYRYARAGKIVKALRRNANSCTCACGNNRLILIER